MVHIKNYIWTLISRRYLTSSLEIDSYKTIIFECIHSIWRKKKLNFNFLITRDESLSVTEGSCQSLNELRLNACVANGKWRLVAQGSGDWYQQPKPRSVEHPMSLTYPQPSHEPRPPHQTPNQAPVTLNSEINEKKKTIKEMPGLPWVGRGGRGNTRKHTRANTPNAEPRKTMRTCAGTRIICKGAADR